MKAKKFIIAVFLFICGQGNIIAQTEKSVTSGSVNQEKINLNHPGNKESTYYLLLCKLQPDVTSKMSGTFKIETAAKDSTCSICNICHIEVNVSSIDNKMAINNLCNDVNASMVTVQYNSEEYFALEIIGLTNIATISFTGSAENKSLLLVNQNAVTVSRNSRSSTLSSAGSTWEPTTDGIFYNGGNVGIGTTKPTGQVHIGKQEATAGTVGVATRLTLQPYGHTGGPWNIICRDTNHDAYWELHYGLQRLYAIQHDGNVGIGTTPEHKLDVAGNIRSSGTVRANEVIVTSGGADFVFASDYHLRPLAEVEQFITANRHLPEIAPADSMIQNGVNMGEFQIQLLQKIEELTLYMIEQAKQNEELKRQLQMQQQEIEKLKRISR